VDGVPSFDAAYSCSSERVAKPPSDDEAFLRGKCLGVEHKGLLAAASVVTYPPRKANVPDAFEPFTGHTLSASPVNEVKYRREARIARCDSSDGHVTMTVIDSDARRGFEAVQEVSFVLSPRKLLIAVRTRQPRITGVFVWVSDGSVAK